MSPYDAYSLIDGNGSLACCRQIARCPLRLLYTQNVCSSATDHGVCIRSPVSSSLRELASDCGFLRTEVCFACRQLARQQRLRFLYVQTSDYGFSACRQSALRRLRGHRSHCRHCAVPSATADRAACDHCRRHQLPRPCRRNREVCFVARNLMFL